MNNLKNIRYVHTKTSKNQGKKECSDIQGKSCISACFAKHTLLGSLRMEYQFFHLYTLTCVLRHPRKILHQCIFCQIYTLG